MIRGQNRSRRIYWLLLFGAASFVAACRQESVRAQSPASLSSQLSQRLEQPVTLTWQGQQLVAALQRLGDAQRISIWIDRRVDPSTPVELSVSDQPLDKALTAVLAPHGWAASPYHGVLYIGPKQTSEELRTLSALARRSLNGAPADARSRWLQAESWSFARLSEPRALLLELTNAAGAKLEDDGLIPHDLWPARDLPPMPIIDRTVLLLAGFDLTCEISANGRQCRIVPIQRPVQISATYTVGNTRRAAVESVLQELSAAKATRRGAKLTLAATVEAHDRVRAAMQGKAATASKPARSPQPVNRDAQRFTLKIANQPVGPVVDQLARQLKLNIDWTAGAEARNSLISCEVREATLDELLGAILSTAELTFKRDGAEVTITR